MKKPLGWLVGAVVSVGMAVAVLAAVLERDRSAPPPVTVGERLAVLKTERAGLQARAEGEGRLALIGPLRVAGLLLDALVARGEEPEQSLERIAAPRRQAFAEADLLNAALKDALARPTQGAVRAARKAADRAQSALERLADNDSHPLVLSVVPRFVPPRRATGDLTVEAPAGAASPLPQPAGVRLKEDRQRAPASAATGAPTVPRYAPSFVAPADEDPPVTVEIAGLHLVPGGPPPVLTVGSWRGIATVAPERLRFAVPRKAFPTDAVRATLVTASLAIRSESRPAYFEVPFIVLPDRPGSMALDQKIRTTSTESTTLVSPEILARAPAGESQTVRRCFDPPAGTRFDKERRRVIVVERLAWVDDVSDPTANAGTVEFAHDEGPNQICLVVVTRAAAKAARTATIGRFEATLVRDKIEERAERSGVRALDWHEPTRVAIDPDAVEWRLYLRLFDEVDREFRAVPERLDLPFLSITVEPSGRSMILKADPAAEP